MIRFDQDRHYPAASSSQSEAHRSRIEDATLLACSKEEYKKIKKISQKILQYMPPPAKENLQHLLVTLKETFIKSPLEKIFEPLLPGKKLSDILYKPEWKTLITEPIVFDKSDPTDFWITGRVVSALCKPVEQGTVFTRLEELYGEEHLAIPQDADLNALFEKISDLPDEFIAAVLKTCIRSEVTEFREVNGVEKLFGEDLVRGINQPDKNKTINYQAIVKELTPEQLAALATMFAQEQSVITADSIACFDKLPAAQQFEIAKLCVIQDTAETVKLLNHFKGLTHPQRFTLLTLCAEKNGADTAKNHHLYEELTPDQRYKLAKTCTCDKEGCIAEYIHLFPGLNEEQRFRIAGYSFSLQKKAFVKTVLHIQNFGLSSDYLFKTAMMSAINAPVATAENIKNFEGLTPDQLFEVAKLCSEWEDKITYAKKATTAEHINSFEGFTTDQLFEIAMLSATSYELGKQIRNFEGLTPDQLFEIAKVNALETKGQTAQYIDNFERLTPEQSYKIAKICAKANPLFTAAHIKKFTALTPDDLFKIAKLLIEKDTHSLEIIEHIPNFESLTPEHLHILAKQCILKNPGVIPSQIQNFKGLSSENLNEISIACAHSAPLAMINNFANFNALTQEQRFIIICICAKKHPNQIEKNIKKFGEYSQEQRYKIAMLCADQWNSNTAQYIQNFGEFTQRQRDKLAKTCAGRWVHTAKYLQNFGVVTPGKLFRIATLCAYKRGDIGKYIHYFGNLTQEQQFEIAKKSIITNPSVAGQHIHRFTRLTKEQHFQLAKQCIKKRCSICKLDIDKLEFTSEQYLELINDSEEVVVKKSGYSLACEINFLTSTIQGFKGVPSPHCSKLIDLRYQLVKLEIAEGYSSVLSKLANKTMGFLSPDQVLEVLHLYAKTMKLTMLSEIYTAYLNHVPGLSIQQKNKIIATALRAGCQEQLTKSQYAWLESEKLIEALMVQHNPALRLRLINMVILTAQIDGDKRLFGDRGITGYRRNHRNQILNALLTCLNHQVQDPALIDRLKVAISSGKEYQIFKDYRQFQALVELLLKITEAADLPAETKKIPIQWMLQSANTDKFYRSVLTLFRHQLDNDKFLTLFKEKIASIEGYDQFSDWKRFTVVTEILMSLKRTIPQKDRECLQIGLGRVKQADLFYQTRAEMLTRSASDVDHFGKMKQVLEDELNFKTVRQCPKLQMLVEMFMGLKELDTLSPAAKEELQETIKKIATAEGLKQSVAEVLQIFLFDEASQLSASTSSQELIRKVLSEKLSISANKATYKLFQKTFGSCRDKNAIITYAAKMHTLNDPAIHACLGKFVQSVLDDRFQEERYSTDNNPHLEKIKEAYPAIYDAWQEGAEIPLDFSSAASSSSEFQVENWLKEKLADFKHIDNAEIPDLVQYLQSVDPEEKRMIREKIMSLDSESPFLKLQQHCIQLLENDQEIMPQLKTLETLFEDPALKDLEFARDVKALIRQLSQNGVSLENLVFVNTDNPYDLLLCGTEVLGSCQDVAGSASLNKCLLGYIRDGKNRLLAVKDKNGKILYRCIYRLLWNGEKPVLFLEQFYPDIIPEPIKEAIINYAKEHAAKMDLPLTSVFVEGEEYPKPLQALGGPVPYEYCDAAKGVCENGEFSISGAKQL